MDAVSETKALQGGLKTAIASLIEHCRESLEADQLARLDELASEVEACRLAARSDALQACEGLEKAESDVERLEEEVGDLEAEDALRTRTALSMLQSTVEAHNRGHDISGLMRDAAWYLQDNTRDHAPLLL